MFIELSNRFAANEDEFYGKENLSIKLSDIIDWINKVKSSPNAKYLKCLNYEKNKITVNSITDIVFSSNLVHKERNIEHGIKIAFKEEDPNANAMTIERAAELLDAIVSLCNEQNIDTSSVLVFCENNKGRLTTFSWYYDTDTDTAVIVKNMYYKVAAKFMHGAEDIIIRTARSPKTSTKLID